MNVYDACLLVILQTRLLQLLGCWRLHQHPNLLFLRHPLAEAVPSLV